MVVIRAWAWAWARKFGAFTPFKKRCRRTGVSHVVRGRGVRSFLPKRRSVRHAPPTHRTVTQHLLAAPHRPAPVPHLPPAAPNPFPIPTLPVRAGSGC